MRSRYSAYVNNKESYLLDTWYPSTRPVNLNLSQEPTPKWLGLKIVATHTGGSEDSEGKVEFVARYSINGKATRIHELSRFIKENGRWFYLDGKLDE